MLSSVVEGNEKATKPMCCDIPSKRRRMEERLDGNSEVDLVYPFYALDDTGGGSGTTSYTAVPPLALADRAFSLNFKAPLGLDANQLTLLMDSSGPITVTGTGLTLRVDSAAFTIENGTLKLKSNPGTYVSPYTILEIMPPEGLNGTYAIVATDLGSVGAPKTWNVGYYVHAVASGGMVNAVVNMQIQRTNMYTADKNSINDGISFTFVLCYFGTTQPNANLSNLHAPTVTPPENTYFFVPNHIAKATTNSPDFITLPQAANSNTTNWYVPADSPWMSQHQFVPIVTNQTDKFGVSTVGVAPGNIDQDLDVDDVMIITVNIKQTSGGNWYDNTETQDRLTTGPLSFSYQGYVTRPANVAEKKTRRRR
ncbi:fiber 1 protein [Southern Psittacara leucophthalmus aviadenovirus]|uniref:Fiber 1 protein n=1 Tax=Southern Psittacara leucophthalmus aviadenovirus TaxID=2604330 RepID=A0AAF1DB86_9ADEN|nr:fiber 1 protein [Southern Psittacara leucophthalmus aviadenovirus]QEJ80782.1 fiber 1 protein [Southern Psittacara leucophthalmus aviadenovirus]